MFLSECAKFATLNGCVFALLNVCMVLLNACSLAPCTCVCVVCCCLCCVPMLLCESRFCSGVYGVCSSNIWFFRNSRMLAM